MKDTIKKAIIEELYRNTGGGIIKHIDAEFFDDIAHNIADGLVKNLTIPVVCLPLLEEEKLEAIENALFATKRFSIIECTNLSQGILLYIQDDGHDIVKTNEA